MTADCHCEWRAVVYFDVDDELARRLARHPVYRGPWIMGDLAGMAVRVECRHCNDGYQEGRVCWVLSCANEDEED